MTIILKEAHIGINTLKKQSNHKSKTYNICTETKKKQTDAYCKKKIIKPQQEKRKGKEI